MKEANTNSRDLSITTAILAVITTLCLTTDISLTDKLFTSIPFGILAGGFGYAAINSIKKAIASKTNGLAR